MVGPLGRRVFLAGAAALPTGFAMPRAVWAAQSLDFDGARHLLARATFSPTPAEIHALEGQDHAAAVDRLLAGVRRTAVTPPPDWIGEGPAELREKQRAADARRADAQREDANRKPGVGGKPLRISRPVEEQGRELRNWWIEEMLATDQPLTERLVLFWHNHFTSSLQKVRFPPALFRQNALFRREAAGNFATLLREVARDPAMLIYLDGMRSVAKKPNENFARELLELFTLGEGHYGEADIREAARAFTGWSVDRQTGAFVARPGQHDGGEKRFLGQAGRFGGDDIVTILLAQPRTAETIVEKMWREFVSPMPDPAEVKRLAAEFRRDYEIKPLLRALLTSEAFRDPVNRGTLIKSPVDLIVGTVHLLGLPVPEKTQLARMLQGLGQALFDPPNVKGWPGGDAWISTYTLLLRQQFLRRIVEATAVAPMDGALMTSRANRREERREQLPQGMARGSMAPGSMSPDSMAPGSMAMAEPRPIEGRSLRMAGAAVRLGPSLAGSDSATLLRTALAVPAIDGADTRLAPDAALAAGLLDTAYQLK